MKWIIAGLQLLKNIMGLYNIRRNHLKRLAIRLIIELNRHLLSMWRIHIPFSKDHDALYEVFSQVVQGTEQIFHIEAWLASSIPSKVPLLFHNQGSSLYFRSNRICKASNTSYSKDSCHFLAHFQACWYACADLMDLKHYITIY